MNILRYITKWNKSTGSNTPWLIGFQDWLLTIWLWVRLPCDACILFIFLFCPQVMSLIEGSPSLFSQNSSETRGNPSQPVRFSQTTTHLEITHQTCSLILWRPGRRPPPRPPSSWPPFGSSAFGSTAFGSTRPTVWSSRPTVWPPFARSHPRTLGPYRACGGEWDHLVEIKADLHQ